MILGLVLLRPIMLVEEFLPHCHPPANHTSHFNFDSFEVRVCVMEKTDCEEQQHHHPDKQCSQGSRQDMF
jgi:hypothetical protein